MSLSAQVANKSTTALSPSIVETYSRLLVYSEIESLGIKGFLNQLLPKVFVQQSWGTLHTLLEIFSYRLYHIQAHYRLSLLTHLHQLATHNILNNHAQLQLTVESSALRSHLIMLTLFYSKVAQNHARSLKKSLVFLAMKKKIFLL